MAQQVGGEGADRIQGFQAAPVVDQERGKTLETRVKVKRGYVFNDLFLKVLMSWNSAKNTTINNLFYQKCPKYPL